MISKKSLPAPATVLHLWLPGYVTPSLNELTGRNRFIMMKHRRKAQAALSSASPVIPVDASTMTTFGVELRRYVTHLDILSGFQTMTPTPLCLSSGKGNAATRTAARKS